MATIGLAVVSYVLEQLQKEMPDRCATLDWRSRPGGNDILLFEAFVSGENHAGPGEHWKDALNAAEGFRLAIDELGAANAIHEECVFSLVGACLMRTGWTADTGVLGQSCLVIRP